MLAAMGCLILMTGHQICYSGTTITCADMGIPNVPICQHVARAASYCVTTTEGVRCAYNDPPPDVCTMTDPR